MTMNEDVQYAIQSCLECHSLCVRTAQYCLEKGGRHAEANHIRGLTDCAEICDITANFLLRNSELQMELAETCADVCNRCADDCERMAASLQNDIQMETCADFCRRCAQACEVIKEPTGEAAAA